MEEDILPVRKSPITTKNMHLEICRVCLSKSREMVNIFGSTPGVSIPISEMISLVTGHNIVKDDFFSEIICRTCLEDATRAFKIKQTYERSYLLLCKVKDDFQEVDKSGISELQMKTEPSKPDLLENGEQCPDQLRVSVKTEPLDGPEPRNSPKEARFEDDLLNYEELDQCPVKNEPIEEDEEEHEVQFENQQPNNRGKSIPSTLPHKCSYCPKSFSLPWKLKDHIRYHSKERPFKCSHCPSAFKTNSCLQQHLKGQTHITNKPFKCSQCRSSCKTESSLNRHLLQRHKKRTTFECDLCQHSYADEKTLQIHRFNCEIISKLVSSGAMILPNP